jgi:DNA invertase Pin-like site-specific DNA recombinase
MTRRIIAYYRVSTFKQGRSGLGLEAQREALARFGDTEGFEIVREFVEIETGKGADGTALTCGSTLQTMIRMNQGKRHDNIHGPCVVWLDGDRGHPRRRIH